MAGDFLAGVWPLIVGLAAIYVVMLVASVAFNAYTTEPLVRRQTSFGRLPFSRKRRRSLLGLVPIAISAVEQKQLRNMDDERLCDMGMVLEGLTGELAEEPDVVNALKAIKEEYGQRVAVAKRASYVTSVIERRAQAIDRNVTELERRNKTRLEAGLQRIDDELLWKAPLFGSLRDWTHRAFKTDQLQITAGAQMEELLLTIAEKSEELSELRASKLTANTFWAVGIALELYANTLPKHGASDAEAALILRLQGTYLHWVSQAKHRGPAPEGSSLLERDIIVNAANHELSNLSTEAEEAGRSLGR
jgi:hypothetical protein